MWLFKTTIQFPILTALFTLTRLEKLDLIQKTGQNHWTEFLHNWTIVDFKKMSLSIKMLEEVSCLLSITLIIVFVQRILKFVYVFFVKPFVESRPKIRKGDWVIVTGATSGIGKEYAKKFIECGSNCILVGRNQIRLERTRAELLDTITNELQPEICCLTFDFSNNDQKEYERLALEIGHIVSRDENQKLCALVNNVGVTTFPKKFMEHSIEKYTKLCNVNIMSTLQMTYIVLPYMIVNKKGLIINVSSALSKIPSPLVAVYASTKAFISKFSESLHTEYSFSNKIFVQCVTPGYVSTKMVKTRPSYFVPSAHRFVKSAFSTISYYSDTAGYVPHIIWLWIIVSLEFLFPGISSFVTMYYFENLNKFSSKRTST